MKVSDSDLEKAKEAWRQRCPGMKGWVAPLRAAIEALPDPQPEPVPGAAVRALVAKWRAAAERGAIGGHTGPLLADELEAALRTDGLASQELPTVADCDQLRAELESVRRQLDEYRDAERWAGLPEDQTGEHLPLVMAARRMSTELEMRTRELEKTRAELERERMRLAGCGVAARGYPSDCLPEYESDSLDGVRELYRRKEELREQHEALRAGVEALADAPDSYMSPGWIRNQLRALLKPAPAEAEVEAMTAFVMDESFGDPPSRMVQHPPPESAPAAAECETCHDQAPDLCSDAAHVQHPPPEPTTWEQAMTARVERLERALRLLLGGISRNLQSGELNGQRLERAAHDAWKELAT